MPVSSVRVWEGSWEIMFHSPGIDASRCCHLDFSISLSWAVCGISWEHHCFQKSIRNWVGCSSHTESSSRCALGGTPIGESGISGFTTLSSLEIDIWSGGLKGPGSTHEVGEAIVHASDRIIVVLLGSGESKKSKECLCLCWRHDKIRILYKNFNYD